MKVSQEQYKEWKRYCEELQSSSPSVLLESYTDKQKRIERFKNDYQSAFEYYFSDEAKCTSAPFHIKFANTVKKEKRIRAIFEAFRGSAKSTHATVGVPFWLMIDGDMKTMVLVGETEAKACILLGTLQAHLQFNKKIHNDFGTQVNAGSWAEGYFITTSGVAFYAIGLGQSPRGLRNGANRPDYIVCDDLDTKERCKNPKRVREAVEWITDDLMGCFDIGNERFVLCNNRIHKNSILTGLLSELKGSSKLVHLKVNAIDKNGNPTWPSKYTKEYWIEKQIETTYRSFQREYMNNPIEEGTIFKNDWIQFIKILPLKDYVAHVTYCDPSFKSTSTSDFKAIVWLGLTKDNQIHVIDSFCRKTTITEMVHWHYAIANKVANLPISISYYIEANMLQDLLLDDFQTTSKEYDVYVPIRADKRKKPDKFARIENLTPLFERGIIKFNQDLKETSDYREGISQLLNFEQGSRTADDYPDALEGGVFKIFKRNSGISKQPGLINLYNRHNSRSY